MFIHSRKDFSKQIQESESNLRTLSCHEERSHFSLTRVKLARNAIPGRHRFNLGPALVAGRCLVCLQISGLQS